MQRGPMGSSGFQQTPGPWLYALNDLHHDKTPGDQIDAVEAAEGWRPGDSSLEQLVAAIKAGHGWCGARLRNGKRSEETVTELNLVVLDIDGDFTLDQFWSQPFAKNYCQLTYTTCSHSPEAHRFRAIFMLPNPLQANEICLLPWIHAEVIDRLGLGDLKDTSGSDPARLWFGNSSAEVLLGEAPRLLPWELTVDADDRRQADVAAAAERREQRQIQRTADGPEAYELLLQRVEYAFLHLLPTTADGEYSSLLMPAFHAAVSAEDDRVWQAFADWHSRGHHARSKRNNLRRLERSRAKAGRKSDPAVVLKLLKERLPNWTERLPDHLRPKTRGSALSWTSSAAIRGLVAPAQTAVAVAPAIAPVETAVERAHGLGHGGIRPAAPPASGGGGGFIPPANPRHPGPGPEDDDPRARLEALIETLYALEVQTPRDETAILLLRGELLKLEVFRQSPGRIDRLLLDRFRLLMKLQRSEGEAMVIPLSECTTGGFDWLIPDLLLRGRDALIHSKAGVGKTTFSLQLAAAIVGAPFAHSFLDCPNTHRQAAWEAGERVLFIASDMGADSASLMASYASELGWRSETRQNNAVLQRIELITGQAAKRSTGSAGRPSWTAELKGLLSLHKELENPEKPPVAAVIIDSMKSICPPGIRVGSQEFVEVYNAVVDLCNFHDVALIWVHHSNNDGNTQGIMRIPEQVSTEIKMIREEEGNRIKMVLNKVRGARTRTLFLQLHGTEDGMPVLVGAPSESSDEQGSNVRTELVLQILRQARSSQGPGGDGLTLSDIHRAGLWKDAGLLPPHERTLQKVLSALVDSNEVERRGSARNTSYRITGGGWSGRPSGPGTQVSF